MSRTQTASILLSPKDLAMAVGVSESSLRRWVDDGRIEFSRTAGGHRRIALADALRFIRSTHLRVVRPDILGMGPSPDALAGHDRNHDDQQNLAGLLEEFLLAGDAGRARTLLLQLYLDGWSLASLFDGPLRDAMTSIGELWLDSETGVVLEHRATQIVYDVLHHFSPLITPPPLGAPVAVGGVQSQDEHVMASLMCSMILTDAGYRAINLGAATPTEVMLTAIATFHPTIVWRAVNAPVSSEELAPDLARLADVMHRCKGTLIVGGRHVLPEAIPFGEHVLHIPSMTELETFAQNNAGVFEAQDFASAN